MKTKKIVTTAMLLAIAVVLSLVKIINLPFGGSVTLASMVPIIIISYMYGVKWGVFSAFVYAVLQLLTGIDTIAAFFLPGSSKMHLWAALSVCFIDYILAYTMLGLGGIFKGRLKKRASEICVGALFAVFLRYLMHIISGAIFFGTWAEWFFSDYTGLSQISVLKGFCTWVMNNFSGKSLALFYSLIYNGCYMLPEIIITAIAVPIVYKILHYNDIV